MEATLEEIRALIELADLDAHPPASGTRLEGREAMAHRVPRRLLDRYQLLLEVGRTPALVPIERGACSGCHVRLPTMVEYNARRTLAVHACPHCRRMLYASQVVHDHAAPQESVSRRAVPASSDRRS